MIHTTWLKKKISVLYQYRIDIDPVFINTTLCIVRHRWHRELPKFTKFQTSHSFYSNLMYYLTDTIVVAWQSCCLTAEGLSEHRLTASSTSGGGRRRALRGACSSSSAEWTMAACWALIHYRWCAGDCDRRHCQPVTEGPLLQHHTFHPLSHLLTSPNHLLRQRRRRIAAAWQTSRWT